MSLKRSDKSWFGQRIWGMELSGVLFMPDAPMAEYQDEYRLTLSHSVIGHLIVGRQ